LFYDEKPTQGNCKPNPTLKEKLNTVNMTMNAGTFDFSAMSSEQLLALVKHLALEVWARSSGVRKVVVHVVKRIKGWFI
jgi:hypothetical protein